MLLFAGYIDRSLAHRVAWWSLGRLLITCPGEAGGAYSSRGRVEPTSLTHRVARRSLGRLFLALLLTLLLACFAPLLLLEVDEKHGYVGGADAAYARCLTYGEGANGAELFCRLQAQAEHASVVDIIRKAHTLEAAALCHLGKLALDVALVFYAYLRAHSDGARKLGALAVYLGF